MGEREPHKERKQPRTKYKKQIRKTAMNIEKKRKKKKMNETNTKDVL